MKAFCVCWSVDSCGIKARVDTLYSLDYVEVSSATACLQHDKGKKICI